MSQAIDVGDSDSDGNSERWGKWSEPGYILNTNPEEFADELVVVHEGSRGVKDNTKAFGLRKWKERIAITERWDKIIETPEENIILYININII